MIQHQPPELYFFGRLSDTYKMGRLRELIWVRLAGKHPAADEAIEKAKAGEQEGIDNVAAFLGSELLIDKEFAGQVQAIAKEINAGKLLDQSSMTQNNYDNARGFQIKVEGGMRILGKFIFRRNSLVRAYN
jgi:hypothetical protein